MKPTPPNMLLPEDERLEYLLGFQHPLDELLTFLKDKKVASVSGLSGAYLAAVLAQIQQKSGRDLVIICADLPAARRIAADLAAFGLGAPGKDILVVPPPDVSPYLMISPDKNRITERLVAQFRLAMGDGGRALVLPMESALRKVIPWHAIEAASILLSVGEQQIDLDDLRSKLVQAGYNPVRLVEDPGTFASRGGLLDVFTPYHEHPVRIDLFGDEVESIRLFDPLTQRTYQDLSEIFILPVREEIKTDSALEHASKSMRRLGDQLELPSRMISEILQNLQSGFQFFGIESLLPAFFELEPILPSISGDQLWVVTEPELLAENAASLLEQRQQEYQQLISSSEVAFPPEAFYCSPDSLLTTLESKRPLIELDSLGGNEDEHFVFRCQGNHDLTRLRKAHEEPEGAVHALVRRLNDWRPLYGRIAFACHSLGTTERLAALLRSYGQKVNLHQTPIPLDPILPPPTDVLDLYAAPISAGFRSPYLSLGIIAESEILGPPARKRSARVVEEALSVGHFRELTAGDLVVHLDFGIARYEGMEKLILDGIAGDYLVLQFADNDKLYLPVYRLGRVQKYLASQDKQPPLDKMGSARWERSKERVKKDLEALADELLRLYAERQTRLGHQVAPPGDFYREFEATFPFDETPHQLTAIEEVIEDMTSPQPMDRLLCGDVGFGKTEVAIRAAFLSALDGNQVALLVPTTILAEQHLRTFTERLRLHPIRIEALSRFRSAKESAAILADLASGKIDILIGTHRILSEDVDFRKLGLLIIDEEQRFGVKHKERLKQLKSTLDVLTMTATPIPRTLEMSLLGIRDLSVIMTPPNDRLAIITRLAQFSESIIRQGILDELRRGGQVFFVHNRVQGLEELAKQIREIVPEARLDIGHAQMSNTQLERVMANFLNRKTDVLLCTTIIESGLDITSANTIFINRADAFGLAQLYQLRGRVGRGRERAYCYLLVPSRRKLTPESARRLEVIRTNTDLASGITIAQHDLDIRGAGNLLGSDQSGHIRSVGYDLFCELLEETIRHKQGQESEDRIEPEVKIPVEAYLPTDFIADEGLRLLFYKRLSVARDQQDLDTVVEELADRFGRLPPEALRLRSIILIKISLARLAIESIEVGPNAVVLKLSESCRLAPTKVVDLVDRSQGRYQLRHDMRLVRKLGGKEREDLLSAASMVVREIQNCAT